MDLTTALIVAQTLSFVVFGLIALWYGVPWLSRRSQLEALVPLLWIHAFRHVALQLFSAVERQGAGFPENSRDQIAYGDLIGMLLAVAALLAIRYRRTVAVPVVWVFVVASVIDLGTALITGIREDLLAEAFGVPWLILAFYVPALWLSLILIVWRLLVRSNVDSERRNRPATASTRPTSEGDR